LSVLACGTSRSTSSIVDTSSENDTIDSLGTDTIKINEPEIDLEQKRIDSLTQVYKQELFNVNQAKANRITTFYLLAQQKFYSGEHSEALFLINQAARVKETADILALKGSIYYGLGSIENFLGFWRRALEMDENVPIPPSPVIISELKKYGLIDE
jgi:tetratricopeptide (TPR) repeat protein